jgi:hypothetical protein
MERLKNAGNVYMLLFGLVYFLYLAWAFYRQAPKLELGISLGVYCLAFSIFLVFMYYKLRQGVWYDAGNVILVALSYALNFAFCMYLLTSIRY